VFLIGLGIVALTTLIALAGFVVIPAIVQKPTVTPNATMTLPAAPSVSPPLSVSPTVKSHPTATAISLLTPTPMSPEPCKSTPPPGYEWYIIQEGDTLSGIAARHGMTVIELKLRNNLMSDRINMDDCLLVRKRD
jgi:LysM repeat protein